ncbi:aldo/keto reductase [Streptomyces sp. NPDC087538]|uniref:aldo/keto reductase n=1 Tax=Streptomyces sp. NPDC087538 TaxID=3365797 RepID=UPI003816620B
MPAPRTERPVRIGYARTSTARQGLASQLEALHRAECHKVFKEQISTRVKVRPELEKALALAHQFKEAAPETPVILTVHELKRLARNAAELMTLSAERGVGVVVGGVFNSGLLADPRPGATFDYTTASDALLSRALELQVVCERHGVPLRAAALRFPFGHPAVASVLVGARNHAEIEDAAAMLQSPAPAALWEELKALGLLAAGIPTPQGVH